MGRERRRLLVAPERLRASAGALPLEPEEVHYLRRVLRLRGGDALALVDGVGHLWGARLALPAGAAGVPLALLEQSLDAPLEQEPPPAPRLALAVALPRLDADVLLRMACELGLDRFQPLRAGRSRPAEGLRPERRQAILREALEQCERLWLPRLDPEEQAQSWLAQAAAGAAGSPAPGLRLLASTRRGPLPALEEMLLEVQQQMQAQEQGLRRRAGPQGLAQPAPSGEVCVAIGPEGGWTPAEEQAAAAGGWRPVSLSSTILRTSTAAVAAAVRLAAWRARSRMDC